MKFNLEKLFKIQFFQTLRDYSKLQIESIISVFFLTNRFNELLPFSIKTLIALCS